MTTFPRSGERGYIVSLNSEIGAMARSLKMIAWVSFACLLLAGASMLAAGYLNPSKPYAGTKHEYLLELEAETLLNDPKYAMQFIRTSEPEPAYNCHGWTFAGGKRSVGDGEVYRWLSGFRYRPVIIPEPEDIVVYYDRSNVLCHSGVVKATGANGFVLVESKWGALGRFMHKLEAPQVAASHAFYRKVQMPPMPPRRFGPGNRIGVDHRAGPNAGHDCMTVPAK
jgi:hypothetical protein